MNRKLLWAVLVIGLALVIAPLAMSLPSKANAGERMLNSFQPIMQPDQVATTARYYNDVFVPLGTVTPMMRAENLATFQAYLKGFGGMQTDAAKLLPLLAQAMNMTPAQVQAMIATQLPSMAAMLQNLPAMQRDFGGLLGTMQQNVGIFSQVPCRARPLSAARHDDAGERGQLRAGLEPALVPAVRLVLHRPRAAAHPDCQRWSDHRARRKQGSASRPPDAGLARAGWRTPR